MQKKTSVLIRSVPLTGILYLTVTDNYCFLQKCYEIHVDHKFVLRFGHKYTN